MAQNSDTQAHACATISLLTPGRVLHLSALLVLKRYRDKGNKAGAVKGYQLLQQEELGELVEMKPQRGASIVCSILLSTLVLRLYAHFAQFLKYPLIQFAYYTAVGLLMISDRRWGASLDA